MCVCVREHVYTCQCAHMLVCVHKNVLPEVGLCHKFARWGPMTKDSPESKTQSPLNTDSSMKALSSVRSTSISTIFNHLYRLYVTTQFY